MNVPVSVSTEIMYLCVFVAQNLQCVHLITAMHKYILFFTIMCKAMCYYFCPSQSITLHEEEVPLKKQRRSSFLQHMHWMPLHVEL